MTQEAGKSNAEDLADNFVEHTDITGRKECWLSGYFMAEEIYAQQREEPWVRVEDGYPKSKSDIIFIVRGSRDYDGRILGGRYTGYDDEPNEFSTPGMGYCASHWKYSPPAPPKD